MGRRNCASCRHYERSSIARMGWCRNPELYAPHHNHLVSADDLDCDRGAGDFWEPIEHQEPAADRARQPVISVTSAGVPVYPVSGSSGYSSDPPPPGDSGGPPWGSDFDYYDGERTLADYARIAAPILGVIVLVILLWFWIANFLDDDDDNGDVASGTATELPSFTATGEPTEATDGTPAPPGVAPTPTEGGVGVATPTSPPGGGDEATDEPSDGDPGTGGDIYVGATVEVANTGGAGVNVRAEASTAAEVLTVFLDGTQVQVIGGPFEGEGYVWWQVTGNEVASGWIVADYLFVVE